MKIGFGASQRVRPVDMTDFEGRWRQQGPSIGGHRQGCPTPARQRFPDIAMPALLSARPLGTGCGWTVLRDTRVGNEGKRVKCETIVGTWIRSIGPLILCRHRTAETPSYLCPPFAPGRPQSWPNFVRPVAPGRGFGVGVCPHDASRREPSLPPKAADPKLGTRRGNAERRHC